MSSRFVSLFLLLAACSYPHDVRAVYAAGAPETGAVDVVLNHATAALTVSIGDKLVVDREHSRRAHVDGVPAGPAHVRVATSGECEHRTLADYDVVIPPNGNTTLALPGPDEDFGCAVFSGLLYIGAGVEAIAVVAVVEAARQAQHALHGGIK